MSFNLADPEGLELVVNSNGENFSYNRIYFKQGYKYQLDRPMVSKLLAVNPSHIPTSGITTRWMSIYKSDDDYYLWLSAGYASDGPSGPTRDDKFNMVAAFKHDALYQLINLGELPEEAKGWADDELYYTAIEQGMSRFRAWYYLQAVHYFGKANYMQGRPLLTAP